MMFALAGNTVRDVSTAAMIATIAAGLTAGLLAWTTRRANCRTNKRIGRLQQQIANAAGEISALRNESDDRWDRMVAQHVWATDRDAATIIFGSTARTDRLREIDQPERSNDAS